MTQDHGIKRGASVRYNAHGDPRIPISARVDRVHRDGSVTVQARHFLDDKGRPQGAFLGYRYRLDADAVTPGDFA